MNRLIKSKEQNLTIAKCETCTNKQDRCLYGDCPAEYEIVQRLAAYEDTGMEPEQIHGWIPVWERLPDKNGCYLISYTDYDNKTDEIAKVEICEFAKDNDIDVEFWKSGFDAWMPLPEPYREG